jgi:hypothetical protein
MEWGAAVVSILGIIAVLLKAYVARKPQRDEARHEKEIQQGRRDIAEGDADAVSARIDGLLTSAPGDTSGVSDDEATARRLSTICGVATVGDGDGETVGKGGGV